MTATERTFNLLVKVTDCCDRIGVPYYLGFYATRLALVASEFPDKALPGSIGSLEIIVHEGDIPILTAALCEYDDIVLESLDNNPYCADTFLKVADRNTTFLDLMNPTQTTTPAYAVFVVPLTAAPIKERKARQEFLKAHYDIVKKNQRSVKPFFGFMRLLHGRKKCCSARTSEDFYHLLRYKYRKYRFPSSCFAKGCTLEFNGHIFSSVSNPYYFVKMYYKKALHKYPMVSKVSAERYVQLPNTAFVLPDRKKPIMIRVYDKAIRFINRFLSKDLNYVTKQRSFFFRTVDRFEMMEHYAPLKEECERAYEVQDLELLTELLTPYWAMSNKYRKLKIVFAFDSEYYDLLIGLLNLSKRDQKLCNWLISNRDQAFSYLDHVNSYHRFEKMPKGNSVC